jgi:hypothetical protein
LDAVIGIGKINVGDLLCFSEAFQTGREVRACRIRQECNGDAFTLGGERGSRLAPG